MIKDLWYATPPRKKTFFLYFWGFVLVKVTLSYVMTSTSNFQKYNHIFYNLPDVLHPYWCMLSSSNVMHFWVVNFPIYISLIRRNKFFNIQLLSYNPHIQNPWVNLGNFITILSTILASHVGRLQMNLICKTHNTTIIFPNLVSYIICVIYTLLWIYTRYMHIYVNKYVRR